MYDVRRTMYDCQICARCAGKRPAAVSAYGQRGCTAPQGQWRLTALMYDVGCTMYDCRIRARYVEACGVSRIPHAKKWVE